MVYFLAIFLGMLFHLIGIKEKQWQQHSLDILISWWDFSFVKSFLEHWGIVVVSLEEYESSLESFGNILLKFSFQQQEISLVVSGSSLEEALSFFFSLDIFPFSVNFIDPKKALPPEQVERLIQTLLSEYEEASHILAEQQQEIQQKEQKRYENKNIQEALKVINNAIDRVSQIFLIGKWILSSEEIRTLTEYSNDLKKIRLGTNFNKMVTLLLETEHSLQKAEDKVLKALDDKKFLIDRNSVITNIDVISESNNLLVAQEKYLLKQQLTIQESLYLSGKYATIFVKFFKKDFLHQFVSLQGLIPNIVFLLEYFSLVSLLLFSFVALFGSALGWPRILFYFLPSLWVIGIMSYVYGLLPLRDKSMLIQLLILFLFGVFAYFVILLLTATFAF